MTEADYVQDTRRSYDAIATDYEAFAAGDLDARPMDRAMLAAFADTVRDAGGGRVAEIGCGTGRITGHLHSLGLDVFGIDLSPGMLEVARRAYPHLRFDEGSMTGLDLADGALGGVVAWYSLIHVEPGQVPDVLDGFHRVLAPGGHLLLAFQVGDEPLRLTEAFGRTVALDLHRWSPDRLAGLLTGAGFTVEVRMLREAHLTERTPQACLLARKPA
ncbi:class I SAM-dependent DNA methyltransferase [Streptomyces ficellus]|uniref:Class I SAM-dependent methyltransferase n=1 Tax=Streptomyces ficellus TaxID=1977088 RepID=A0A6I6F409_9ACTN|nr:class I SAM-dependent methyltransferase [Streptomyces ficellus]QGV77454.1 class I SAM-dependent methyltransferase [Streptomyces ficellus]